MWMGFKYITNLVVFKEVQMLLHAIKNKEHSFPLVTVS